MSFTDELARRDFYADRLEAHFRSHPGIWIPLLELQAIGGPSWRSRIACDLRLKRKLHVVWNEHPRRSAYMFREERALGPSAEQYRDQTLFNMSGR